MENDMLQMEFNRGYIQGYNEGYIKHQSETMEQSAIQKKQIANIHRVSNNICGKKYSLKLHCFQRWGNIPMKLKDLKES